MEKQNTFFLLFTLRIKKMVALQYFRVVLSLFHRLLHQIGPKSFGT
jgi:hypothetical protein